MEKPNYNPTGKEVFVLYECPDCGRNDCSCVPPQMTTKIPFWIPCDTKCGSFLMYQRAWVVEPHKAADVLTAFVTGDKKIIKELRPGGVAFVSLCPIPPEKIISVSVSSKDKPSSFEELTYEIS